jgi:hypothetical protein
LPWLLQKLSPSFRKGRQAMGVAMRFFLPGANNAEAAEKNYQLIVRHLTKSMGPVREQRYYAIYYKHNGKEQIATVGEPEPLTKEMVIAILRTERDNGPFLICTPNRGVARGHPVFADGGPDTRAIHFEDY